MGKMVTLGPNDPHLRPNIETMSEPSNPNSLSANFRYTETALHLVNHILLKEHIV